MNTNFFTQIAQLGITGDLQLTLRIGADDTLTVSVLLQNIQCEDKAKGLIPPVTLRGSSIELDNGFFEQISAPLQSASGLMVNMDAFMKQLAQVQKQSAMEKEKVEKEKKDVDVKEKKYLEAVEKAEALESEGKYREAWSKLPNPSDYPEQAEILRKRRSELSSKFSPSLFEE